MGWIWGEGQGEGVWRDTTYGTMGSQSVVLITPVLDEQTGFLQGTEPVLVETVVTEGAVEGFDEGVLGRLTGLDVIEVHMAPLGREVEGLAGELWSVVKGNGTGSSQSIAEGVEHFGHHLPSDRGIDMERETLTGAVINEGEASEASSSGNLVMDEVHGPALIGTHGRWQGNPCQCWQLPALLPAQGETFLPVDPCGPLTIDDHSFAFEDVMKDGKPPPGLPLRPMTHPIP